MENKKKRSDIPDDIAAMVLFQSDRTCCVCRDRKKRVQIHHIDGNKLNHDINNLAVLCFECHADTQVSGGFHRKLDAKTVIHYRDDWLRLVAQKRKENQPVKESPDKPTEKTKKELLALRENISQINGYYVDEIFVNEFHEIIDKLAASGIDISEYQIPTSEIDTIPNPSFHAYRPGDHKPFPRSKEKYVKKQYFMMKIDRTLSCL